jgi:hypothetical protein
MVREQLIVNGIDVPLEGSLNPALTYSIQDIKELDKRKSTYSKTITLPGSKVLNDLFNFIFEINIDGTFNPNLKADAVYLVDSQTILDGFIKLNAVHYLDNSHIIYKCVLLGSTANFFTALGEKELTDIQGLNDFEHSWNVLEQRASWDTQIEYLGAAIPFLYGRGYVYPLLDYGSSTDLETFSGTELYPAFYVKELWNRIFLDAGYTYTSSFLSTLEKRFNQAIIPFNGDRFGLSSAQIIDRTFTADTPVFNSSMINIGTTPRESNVVFTDVSDPGNIHNAGIFTTPGTGLYNISASIDVNAIFKPDPTAANPLRANVKTRVTMYIYKVNPGSPIEQLGSNSFFISPDYTYDFPIGGSYTTNATPTAPDDEYNTNVFSSNFGSYSPANRAYNPPNRLVVNLTDLSLFNGDKIEIRVKAMNEAIRTNLSAPSGFFGGGNAYYYNPLNIFSPTYTGETDVNIVNTGLFKANQVNTEYASGDVLDMYSCLPRKIKQKDFITSIINMFNLFIEPDKNNPNNLKIEPRDDFYTTDVLDWSQKLDVSKDLIIKPMALLDASRYIFSYKEDKDYYNEKYLESYADIYGQREVIIENEFLSNTNTNKIIFSPTPLVGQSSNDRVLSTIIKLDQYQQSQKTSSNIRYLIYDGLKDTSSTWNHDGTTLLEYPFSGHFDDAFNPSVDVNFGLPYEIYYDSTYYPINVTNNNLYNEFHKKQLDEITDKDSKTVQGKFYLTPTDISTLSFSNQYFFNNAYHRLLKVNNYNPSDVALTECHFLKLKTADKYTPTVAIVDGGIKEPIGGGGTKDEEFLPVKGLYTSNPKDGNTYNTRTTQVQGKNNIIDRTAKSVSIVGDGNVVGSVTKNITIQGDNNVIESNLENINLINTSGVTVTESNVTYINGEIKGDGADESITTYLCDTTIGGVGIILPEFPTVGKIWNFKKIALQNQLKIAPISSLIDGKSIIYIDALNTSYSIQFDGANYKII